MSKNNSLPPGGRLLLALLAGLLLSIIWFIAMLAFTLANLSALSKVDPLSPEALSLVASFAFTFTASVVVLLCAILLILLAAELKLSGRV